MKEYIVLEEIHGISKKGNPYHMIKFADSKTFANHTLSVDQNFIKEALGLKNGQKVAFETDYSTGFHGTSTVIQRVIVK